MIKKKMMIHPVIIKAMKLTKKKAMETKKKKVMKIMIAHKIIMTMMIVVIIKITRIKIVGKIINNYQIPSLKEISLNMKLIKS